MNTATEKVIRLLLVNEQRIVRAGLRLLIESHPRFLVVGEVANLEEAVGQNHESLDIILIDLKSFSYQATMETVPKLMKSIGTACILLLADKEDPEESLKAVCLGAMGVVYKNETAEILLKAIERVAAGEVWINRTIIAQVFSGFWKPDTVVSPEAPKITALTIREREVVGLIGEGLRNKQIAERLFISEITVRHHLTSIFDKLGVSDRFELAIYSYRHGLAKLPL